MAECHGSGNSAARGLPSYDGSLVSLGGNSMDLVTCDVAVGFMQVDLAGEGRSVLFESLAFRNKDITASARLEFL